MHVRALMSEKARPVYFISCHQTVEDAVNLMTAKRVSALVVKESEHPIGIFAERDVFRCYAEQRSMGISHILLKDAMTAELIVAKPEDNTIAVTARMIKAEIRHLPVIEKDEIVGMLSFGDLIEYLIGNLTDELQHLRDYIADLHSAGQD
jgi:CBS domain-containing protein